MAFIGVLDSGVGGLTVVKELKSNMPNSDIVYFGDTKNCPYGNKSKDEILNLGKNAISFLKQNGVECIVLACNTLSSLANELRAYFDIPIIDIIEPTAKEVGREKINAVGLIASKFTVQNGVYERIIKAENPDCSFFSYGSENLAFYIENGEDAKKVEAEIKFCMEKLKAQGEINALILGCTHYPIAQEIFKRLYPDLLLINPAVAQCKKVAKTIKDETGNRSGTVKLFTSGEKEKYIEISQKLGLPECDGAEGIILDNHAI